jgi:5-methyltetrahydropteroyltriglutamate--homocysteine methyltransferase
MRMLKNDLGYTRTGSDQQLKNACENYWSGKITRDELFHTARQLREESVKQQQEAGIDLIPCNDISFHDHVLDMSLMLGVIPKRFTPVLTEVHGNSETDLYLAMARGYQKDALDIPAMELAKWPDSNYHYIVPEFTTNQRFKLFSQKAFGEYSSVAHILGRAPKPVIIGPVSYLLFGKEKDSEYGKAEDFNRIDFIKRLVPVYIEIINTFKGYGAQWIQVDEPFLCTDLSEEEKSAFEYAYMEISRKCGGIKILLTTWFGSLGENTALAVSLPVAGMHVDLSAEAAQLDDLLQRFPRGRWLSLGLTQEEDLLKDDYQDSLNIIEKAEKVVGSDRLMIAGWKSFVISTS